MNKTNFIISNRNRRYKVNESQFKNIVKESVRKLIKEVGEKHRFGKGAYGLAMDAAKKANRLGRYDQAANLTSHAARYFNDEYGTDNFEMDEFGQLRHRGENNRETMYRPNSRIEQLKKMGSRQNLDNAIEGNSRIERAARTAKAYPRKKMTGGLDAINTVDAQLNTESINRIVKESVNKAINESNITSQFSNDMDGYNKACDLRSWLMKKVKDAQEDGYPIDGSEPEFELINDLNAFIKKNDIENYSDDDYGFGEDWDEERNASFELQNGY